MDFEAGQRVDDYEILQVLGAGGMGKVYKVRNTISDRIEAMKVLLARLDENPELVDRFSREIKVTATLQHPNIATLYTAQRVGNQLAMIMEFVEGSTLDKLMRGGAMPLAQTLEIINQSLAALAYAHSRGVVHRDIKPANIMVTPEGRVKLMDFGIARMSQDRSLTKTGQMVGSLYYMSPEQVEGKSLDARSDLYSLGVTLYELVTSKKPFEGDSDYSVMAGHLHQVPRPPMELAPNVSEGLNEIILMALAKDAGQRFQSAAAFRGALGSVAAGMGIPLSAPAEGSSSSRGSGSSLVPTEPATAPKATPMADTVAIPLPKPATPPVTPPPAPPPAFAPQPVASPVMAAIQSGESARSGRRALWMIAGALATLLILGAAVFYVPKWRKANANPATPQQQVETQAPAQAQPATPTQSSATATQSTEPQPPTAATTPVTTLVQAPPSAPPSSQGAKAVVPRQSNSPAIGQVPVIPPLPTEARTPPALSPEEQEAAKRPDSDARNRKESAAELEKVQEELDLLDSRAGAVRGSLDNLQRQQAAQGLGLRGDMVATRQRMETFLGRTQNRLQRGDAEGARKSLEEAEREVSRLEKFLGR
jgi:serine/threonine-protein kinase